MKRTAILLCMILFLAIPLVGCQNSTSSGDSSDEAGTAAGSVAPDEQNSLEFFAMDTYMEIRGYGASDEVLKEAAQAVQNLEHQISTTDKNSEIYAINEKGSGPITGTARDLLTKTLALCDQMDGCLDISIYPIVKAWGFTTDEHRVPPPDEIIYLLSNVNYSAIQLSEEGIVTLPAHMEIDLGSVAKGYTGDMLAEIFAKRGITSGLFSLGGNVQTVGSKPDGSAWNVAIQDPEGEGIIGVLPVIDKAVVTSGGYERYFEGPDGTIYWHIMDPATGYPAKNGLISATAIGDQGIYCDALSTSLFIMGPERAIAYHQAHPDFEMVLVTEDHEILVSEGIAEDFQPQTDAGYSVRIVD